MKRGGVRAAFHPGYAGPKTQFALKHAKPLRRSHVYGLKAAEAGLARGSDVSHW